MARQAIDAIQPTEARTDFSAGLREARKAVSKALRGVKQIFLFTDNQESGWQFDTAAVFDEAWRQTAPKLVVVRTDDLSPVNAAASKVRFDAPFAATGLLARGVTRPVREQLRGAAARPARNQARRRQGDGASGRSRAGQQRGDAV